MSEFTRKFTSLNKADVNIAGGKGASLGEMIQSGIPVPDGFVILSTTFDRFLLETDLTKEIDSIINTLNHKEIQIIENASEKIQGLIKNAIMPENIALEIKEKFKNLNSDYVAVRSSATAEDGQDHAWAGQLDSFLNITEKDLLEKVQYCWASLFTPRAIFYRFEKGLLTTQISVAVVVQKMIQSEVSGIAFSVHPVTEDRNQLIIEAGFGLGEAIVSGSITPDSYIVEKKPRRITHKNISEQKKAIVRSEEGNNWVAIDNEKRKLQKLSDDQILELSEIILNIEEHYGFPCDIEWAFENGNFYIVQSRPITTLIDKNIVQKFLSLIGSEKIIIFEADFYPLFVFLDWLNYYDQDGSMKNIYPFFCYKKGQSTKAYVSLSKYHNVPKLIFESYLDGKLVIEEVNKKYNTHGKGINSLYEKYYESQPHDEEELLSDLSEAYQHLQRLIALTLYLDTLDQQVIEEVLKERGVNINLNKIWEISQILDFVSFDARNTREIIDAIKVGGNIERLQHIFTNYTYIPLPQDLVEKVGQFKVDEEIEKMEESLKEVEENKKIKKDKVESLSFEEKGVLKFIDWSSWLRDDRKALINKADVLFFNLTSKLYEKWGINQDLVPVSFVFEVLKGKGFNQNNSADVEKRKEKLLLIYYGEDRYEENPELSENEVKILDERFLSQNKPQDENVIKGEAASVGRAEGRVRIILKRSEFNDFEEGEILVTGMTRPEFVPLMKKARAIVTDEGGITSHAAIVSRELKKPCVIGTRIATQMLHNGDIVEVDAYNGVVRKI